VRPAPKNNQPLIWGGVAAGVLLVIVAALVLTSKSSVPEESAATPPPKAPPPRAPAPIQAPPPATPPPAPQPPPPPPPPPPPADPFEARKAQIARTCREQRLEGAKKLEEARKHVAETIEKERREAAEFAKRFADLRRDIRLTSGAKYQQALVTGFSADELQVKTIERGLVLLPWPLVSPESIREIAQYVYRGSTPDDLQALARFFVEHRLWKDAQTALHKAKQLDPGLESMVEEFDEKAAPLITGKGLFQGALRILPPAGLRLTYDFMDKVQEDDFDGPGEGLAIADKALTLQAKDRAYWRVGDRELEFSGSVEFEAKVSTDSKFTLGFYASGAGGVYQLEVGPAGIVLQKGRHLRSLTELAKNEKVKLTGEQKVRLVAKQRRIRVWIADKEALSVDDTAEAGEPRGAFLLGAIGGWAKVSGPMVLGGEVNPEYMKKKVGTLEMEVRRLVNEDLAEIRELNAKELANLYLGGSREGVSADVFVPDCLEIAEIPDYEKLKVEIAGRGEDPSKVEAELDAFLKKRATFPSLWYLKGMYHLSRAQPPEARENFAKAIELFPDFYEAHYQVARSWEYAREFQKAFDQAAKVIEVRPDYANAHLLLAEMRFAVDKKAGEQADRDLRVAGQLGADGGEVLQLRRWVKIQTRGPRDVGGIHTFESSHYVIVTDISTERAKWYAEQLELVRGTYVDTFRKWMKDDPRPKPRIAIFNTREAFYTYSELSSRWRAENALGFFAPQNNELVLFEDLDLNATLETLYHEAFHHFASAMLKFPPYWWNEGIAEYMSGVRIEKGAVKERARTLRDRLPGIQAHLRMGYTIPFDKIINYTPAEFYSGPIGLHYAQAWAMIHFFYEFQGGRYRPLIERYFEDLVNGKSQRQAYDAVFEGKSAELEKEWKEYTKGLKLPTTP
jgi:tetratricopeptide (TPR) repeat protein